MGFHVGGEYAELSYGETHYFMFGPEDGKKVSKFTRFFPFLLSFIRSIDRTLG